MKTIEQVRALLQDCSPSKVATATGVHPNTIRNIRDNPDANPTLKVLRAISDHFESRGV